MPTIDYKEIFEKAEVGIALNDPDTGTVGHVNERYAELMGYSPDELRDMPIETISADHPSFDQAAAVEKIQKARAGERQQFDWLFERKDGSHFWGNVVLKRTMVGPKDRLLAFVQDISDRKENERKLEQKNQRLDEFASLVSHDLQNPLSVATGRLELAQAECDSEHLEPVARSLTRMETLIDEMLALARAGDTVGDIEPVELASLVESAAGSVETRSADLRIETDATIRADEHRTQQVLENLLRNAVQHGGDDVQVTVGDLENGFYVQDDGLGIPPDERDEVLKPGFTTEEDGTGFGLGIVRDIADAHGWSIDVTETPSGGARFEFSDVRTE